MTILHTPVIKWFTERWLSIGGSVLLAVLFFVCGWRGLWPLAFVVVLVVELWPLRQHANQTAWLARWPYLAVGLSSVVTIALLPKAYAQATAALLYGVWRITMRDAKPAWLTTPGNALLVQALLFEAIFLGAAVWHLYTFVVMILVWLAAFAAAYNYLVYKGERAAGIMAAAWALVATQITWFFMAWLVSYIVGSTFLIVPQPTLILTTLAYVFGSIYGAQRAGHLNRVRLAEYLIIALILIAIVAAGTPWRGSI